jgi:hypothetical protein
MVAEECEIRFFLYMASQHWDLGTSRSTNLKVDGLQNLVRRIQLQVQHDENPGKQQNSVTSDPL